VQERPKLILKAIETWGYQVAPERRTVTLNQLKVFVLAVRLGSMRAAAQALGVSEPAVSQALTALRQSLGDALLVREGSGMVLTPAGRRVVGLASQMVNLAVEAEAAVRHAQGSPELIRVVATATVGEAVVPALLQAYTHRALNVEATLGIGTVAEMTALLTERLADVAIGPRLSGPAAVGIISEPLQRFRLAFVASRADPLTANGPVSLARLREVDWLVDPTGTDPLSEVGHLLAHARVAESRIRVFPSQSAAWAAAASGTGIAPAVEHIFTATGNPTLVVVPVQGSPYPMFWYASMLGGDRTPTTASRLRRFLGTPDALQAMYRSDGGVPASKFRPPVHVTIWN